MKWVSYSAHDNNLALIEGGLNFTDYHCLLEQKFFGFTNSKNCLGLPKFASSLIFELHEEHGKYFIKILHDGTPLNLCDKSSTVCDYDEFRERILNYVVEDFDTGCAAAELYQKSLKNETNEKREKKDEKGSIESSIGQV